MDGWFLVVVGMIVGGVAVVLTAIVVMASTRKRRFDHDVEVVRQLCRDAFNEGVVAKSKFVAFGTPVSNPWEGPGEVSLAERAEFDRIADEEGL